MKKVAISVISALIMLEGCAMLGAWKSIPPPGGCDQCHTMAIDTNWKVAYQPAALSDERGRPYFQTPEYNRPEGSRITSEQHARKTAELPCFECHKAPTPAHLTRKGRFHH
jgi:hypothetical protein